MIYSPSRTEAFDFCSMKGKLQYVDHWEPKEAGNGTVGKLVGAAFARGSQDCHNDIGNGVLPALSLFDRTVAHYVKYGVSFSMDMGAVRNQLEKSLVTYHSLTPFAGWNIIATELELKNYGRCRLDILGIDPSGCWSIVDIKYKRSLNLDYLNKTVNEYKDSWQFQHYPWAYNQYLWDSQAINDPNAWKYAHQMCLMLVVAKPFNVYYYPFAINELYQKIWLKSAHQKWADLQAIESGERQPTVSTVHRGSYGQCEYTKACLEQQMDPQLMQFNYVQVPRLPDEVV